MKSLKQFITSSFLCLLASSSSLAQKGQPSILLFHGTRVNIVAPALDPADQLASGPATICVEQAPAPQCYIPPKHDPPYGTNPKASVVRLKPGLDVLVFEVQAFGGGSDSIHLLKLLSLGKGRDLSELSQDLTFGDQSEYHFWHEPSISDVSLLVVADALWGSGESHFSKHRFVIKVYTFAPDVFGFNSYSMRDEYLTSGKYASLDDVNAINVLEPERKEIMARLQRQH